MVQEGFFEARRRVRVQCNRTMDTLPVFGAWSDDIVASNGLASHDWLLQRVERAIGVGKGRAKIVVRGPLDLRVLEKLTVGVQRSGNV